MFEDWSQDLPRDEGAGQANTQAVVVPSQRHLDLYRLLRSASHKDRAGRLVCWWPQPKLAASLGVSTRTLQNLLADLRQPGPDPRHPSRTAGLRLGLVRVEATHYRDSSTGSHRLGGNLYVLSPGQHATLSAPVLAAQANTQEPPVACLNEGPPASEGRRVSTPTVSTAPREAPAAAAPTYRTARGRLLDLGGDLADFHAAVDQLDRDTCWTGDRCQAGHRCRRHTRRPRGRG